MMLYISAMDQAGKLKFSSYVHLPPINKIIQYRYARVILCSVVEVIIFLAWVLLLYFSFETY